MPTKTEILAKMIAGEASHDEVRSRLQQMVDEYDTNETALLHFVVDVYDDNFVYEARQQGQQSKFYKQEYTASEDGEITLQGEPKEVMRETQYVEAQSKQMNLNLKTNREGGKKMERKEAIDKLIADERVPYTEEDRESLEKLDDPCFETLQKTVEKFGTAATDEANAEEEKKKKEELEAQAKAETETKAKADTETKANEDPATDKKPQTAEEFLDKTEMPGEIKANLSRALDRDRQEKVHLIEALVKNPRNPFTKEQLEAKELPELEALAKLGDIPKDYSMRSGGESQKEIRVLEAPKMEWKS